MEIILALLLAYWYSVGLLVVFFEYRIRQPDVLVLYESKGQIVLRKSLLYPRHFSLTLKRTTVQIQMTLKRPQPGIWGYGSNSLAPWRHRSNIYNP